MCILVSTVCTQQTTTTIRCRSSTGIPTWSSLRYRCRTFQTTSSSTPRRGYAADYTKAQLCDSIVLDGVVVAGISDGFPSDVSFDSDGSLADGSPYAGKGVKNTACEGDALDIGADMGTVNALPDKAVQGTRIR